MLKTHYQDFSKLGKNNMSSLNKVMLIGRVGKDPELKYTPQNKAVCQLSIATSVKWKDQQGQTQERTEWHRVVLWERLAEVAGEHVRKGKQIYIEGALQTRKWQDQSGQDRYTTEIRATDLKFLGSNDGQQQQPQPQPQQTQQKPTQNDFVDDIPDFDDDIPF